MELSYLAIAILICINIAVTSFLFRLDTLNTFQKYAQTLIVWFIPFLGALMLWLFNRSDSVNTKGKEFGGGPRDSSGSDAEA